MPERAEMTFFEGNRRQTALEWMMRKNVTSRETQPFTNCPHLPVLGLAVTLLTQIGCLRVRSYVDPKLPPVSFGDLHKCASPQPLEISSEFQINGKSNPSATEALRPQVVHALSGSRLFSTVLSHHPTGRNFTLS